MTPPVMPSDCSSPGHPERAQLTLSSRASAAHPVIPSERSESRDLLYVDASRGVPTTRTRIAASGAGWWSTARAPEACPPTTTDERDQRELHPHPSGRQPVAPLLSYGPSVVRRRRDVTAGAPSSGSRVRLCSLHHVTPADGAPRCCMYCVFFPDHRLSNSGSETA